MSNTSINVGCEYLFARLHGIWSKRIQGESLQALIRAESEQQLVRMLGERGVSVSGYGTFHRDLKVRELAMLEQLRVGLSGGLAAFYHGFMRLAFYQNLKTLFHYRYFDDNAGEIARLLIPSPLGDTPDMERIKRTETPEELLKCLALRKFADEIGQCIRRLLDNHDVFQAESAIDRLAYRELREAAEALPAGVRGVGAGLVGEVVDALNISMLLRNLATYHFSVKRMESLWLEGGASLDGAALERLCGCVGAENVCAALPYGLRKVVESQQGGALSGVENALWRGVHRHALREFRSMSDLSLPVVAFPFLLHFETMNIGRVYEGVHFRMNQRELRELLID